MFRAVRSRSLSIVVVLIALGGWKLYRTFVHKSAPEVGSYSQAVEDEQPAVAVTKHGPLGCAKAFSLANVRYQDEQSAAPAAPAPAADAKPVVKESIADMMKAMRQRDAELDQLAFDALLEQAKSDELSTAVVRRIEKTPEPKWNASQAKLVALLDLEGEVNNGGLHQYFFNPSGDGAGLARQALADANATEVAALFDCALTAFPAAGPSPDRSQRLAELAAWGKDQFKLFSDLDDAFYRQRTLEPAINAFIKKNANDFR